MENYQGALKDIRPDAEKDKDYKHEELAGGSVTRWYEKPEKDWKRYTQREQNGSLSCVSQSCAKAMEIIGLGGILSAQPIYRSRINYPKGGMWLPDAGSICKKIGTNTEDKIKSQNQNEQDMNRDISDTTPIKVNSYVFVNAKDIYQIAEAIETQGQCIMIFHGNMGEYLKEIPEYEKDAKINIGHAVCGVDYFLYKGEKVILIEDSSRTDTALPNGQRLITEHYLKNRFDTAMYLVKGQNISDKPQYTFTSSMSFGMINDKQVKHLQDVLKYEGLFPQVQESSGNYYNITAKAVLAFQKKYKVARLSELDRLAGKYVGVKTRTALNKIYE